MDIETGEPVSDELKEVEMSGSVLWWLAKFAFSV